MGETTRVKGEGRVDRRVGGRSKRTRGIEVDKIIELNGTLKRSDTRTSGTREHEGNRIHEIGNEGNE
jgi:hypothetical protein